MKIVIIGSVAAGTSAAAKARRNDEEAEIVVYEKGEDISYSVCGLPYYLGSDDISREQLTPRSPRWFQDRFNISILTGHLVLAINPGNKSLEVKELSTGRIFTDTYDKLVLATGSRPARLSLEGGEPLEGPNCFYLKTIADADRIKEFITTAKPRKALIIGAGFIGLEMAENLTARSISTTILEACDQVMPAMDRDIAVYIEDYLTKKGVGLVLGEKAAKIGPGGKTVVTSGGKVLDADMIIICTGVVPNTDLAREARIALGKRGAIEVSTQMETSVKDIYAAGDCAGSFSLITGKPCYVPLGSTANKMGRIAGDVITGGTLSFRGILGTGIFKVFELGAAKTGLTEREARENGFDVEVLINIKENQSKYLPESRELVIKGIADKSDGRLLGVQIVGERGVDKRIDVFAAAITFGAKAADLFHLDLAYAPPFATTKDPVLYTGMVLENSIHSSRKILSAAQLADEREKYLVIDVRSEKDFKKGHIEDALHIPLKQLRGKAAELDKTRPVVVHCNKGVTGNAAQNLLLNLGFAEVYNLSGGYKHYKKYIDLVVSKAGGDI